MWGTRTVGALAMALIAGGAAWGLFLFDAFVRPVGWLPTQMVWLLWVGCGVFLPMQVFCRVGEVKIETADGDEPSALVLSRSGNRGIRTFSLDALERVHGDARRGVVRLDWRPGCDAATPRVLRCRDAESVAERLRAASGAPGRADGP